MLTKDDVMKIAELFFGGKPEEAYKKFSNMSEWEQFINVNREKDCCQTQRNY